MNPERENVSEDENLRDPGKGRDIFLFRKISETKLAPGSVTQHSPNCDHVVIWNFTLDLLLLNPSLIDCVCNFSSFLVHFVPNIPDDHMITIWTMLLTGTYLKPLTTKTLGDRGVLYYTVSLRQR